MLPKSVSYYLSNYAPPDGHLIGYWLDAQRTFTVLVLYQRDGEPRFSADYFPEIVFPRRRIQRKPRRSRRPRSLPPSAQRAQV